MKTGEIKQVCPRSVRCRCSARTFALLLQQSEWWCWPVRCNASRMSVSYRRRLCRVDSPSLPAFPDGSSFSSVLSCGPIWSERPTQLLNRPLKSIKTGGWKLSPHWGMKTPLVSIKQKKRYIKMVKVPQFSLKNQANKTNKDRLRIHNNS